MAPLLLLLVALAGGADPSGGRAPVGWRTCSEVARSGGLVAVRPCDVARARVEGARGRLDRGRGHAVARARVEDASVELERSAVMRRQRRRAGAAKRRPEKRWQARASTEVRVAAGREEAGAGPRGGGARGGVGAGAG